MSITEEPYQAGNRRLRTWWVEETTPGQTPSDPSWNLFSDNVLSLWGWTPDANTTEQRKLSSLKPQGFFNGSETHDASFTYHLQRWLATVNISNPDSSTELGVASDDSSDTNIDVTIYNDDYTKSETITTDGTDGTTFVAGSTSFTTIGKVELGSSATGTITISTNNSGSAGTDLGTVSSGTTSLYAVVPDDPITYNMLFDEDNRFRATHTVVTREKHYTGGSANGGRHIYTIGKGGYPAGTTLPYETEEGSPIEVPMNYQFEKIRQIEISQPSSSTTVWVQSTDSNDGDGTASGITIDIEDEGANTTETINLNGTTAVQSSNNYTSLDAAELSSETQGNVEIYNGDPSGDPDLLCEIKGKNAYPADEGDLGVPTLGSGSTPSVLGSNYVIFLDDTLQYSGGTSIAPELISGELSIDITLGDNSRTTTQRRNIHLETWNATLTADLAGDTVSIDQIVEYLTETENDITWTTENSNTLELTGCRLMSPGEYGPEQGNAKLVFSNEWSAKDIIIQ